MPVILSAGPSLGDALSQQPGGLAGAVAEWATTAWGCCSTPGDTPGKPNVNRLRWKNLQEHIPQHLLEAIGNEPGYEHLKGNPEALALEWFARQAEARPELLTRPSLVMRMWDKAPYVIVRLEPNGQSITELADYFKKHPVEGMKQLFVIQNNNLYIIH